MTDQIDIELRDRLAGLAAAVQVDAPGSTTSVRSSIRSGSLGRRFALGGLIPVLAVLVIGTVVAGVAKVGPFAPGATGTLPSPTEEPNGPVTTTVTDGPFELTIRSAKARYGHDEPIEIEAVLTYRGPDPSTQISHDLGANGGPMAFGIIEPIPVEGGEIRLNAGYPLICRADMTPCLQPASMCLETPLQQDGGRTDGFEKRIHDGADLPDGDAARAAAQSYLREPELHLPPGTWRPYVIAEFSQGEVRPCSEYAMRAELEIQVLEPAPIVSETAPPANSPQAVTVRDGDFELTLRSDKTTYRPNESIELTGSLVYSGSDDRVEISHDSSGLILFGSREPVYGNINLSTATRLMCMQSVLERNVPVDMPFRKGGGFPTDHPDVDFFRAFMLDPALRLPAGTWHLYAVSSGGCLAGPENPRFALEAEITIEVSGEPVVLPPSTAVPAAPTPEIAPDESPGQIPQARGARSEANNGTLAIRVLTPRARVHAGDPISVFTAFGSTGGKANVLVHHVGLPVIFHLEQLDATAPEVVLVNADSFTCTSTKLGAPFVDVGFGFVRQVTGDGVAADSWASDHLGDSKLHLLVGRWRVTAVLVASTTECVGPDSPDLLQTSIDIEVASIDDGGIDLLTVEAPPTSGMPPCPAGRARGVLALDPVSGLGLVDGEGTDLPVRWPYDFSAEATADGAVLYDWLGFRFAGEGDQMDLLGEIGPDGIFTVCIPVGIAL